MDQRERAMKVIKPFKLMGSAVSAGRLEALVEE
jgi:hypothetical protein